MFVIDPAPTFDAQVNITQPGKTDAAVLNLTFKYQDAEELATWTAGLAGRKDVDALSDIVLGWRDVATASGALPFSKDNLGLVLTKYHTAAEEIYSAYFSQLKASRQKN